MEKNVDKYKNKYRIASARAQWWDYGWNGAYFITICTENREHFFGNVIEGKMNLSPTGVIADILWHEIGGRSKFVELGDFVVMPNHIHGILILNKPGNLGNNPNPNPDSNPNPVETLRATSLRSSESDESFESQPTKNEHMAKISPKSNTISTIIRSYKSAVTKHANRLGLENGWQARFHDRIIRNNVEYQSISDYIITNPQNWKGDKFYSR